MTIAPYMASRGHGEGENSLQVALLYLPARLAQSTKWFRQVPTPLRHLLNHHVGHSCAKRKLVSMRLYTS